VNVSLPRLFTSRWANRDLANLACLPVGISRGVPRWPLPYRYRTFRALAPSRKVFGIEDECEFAEAYKAQLETLGVEEIIAGLAGISQGHNNGRPLVLLCWEKPGQFCHRRLLANWIEKSVGVEVPELVSGMVPRDNRAPETLFKAEGGQV
jgi:hypothetical protein